MPEFEKQEYRSSRHAFLHVPQRLFPFSRPNGTLCQYLHLTQLLYGCDTHPKIGLSLAYQIILHFDHGYFGMKKQEVQDAAVACFELIGIPIAQCFREPISTIIYKETHNWLDFIKVDLLNHDSDGIALLQGDRIFTMQLQIFEYVIAKVEKGFEFVSTTINRKLKIQSHVLSLYSSRDLLGELTKLGYLFGANLEFIGISKKLQHQNHAEITIASEQSKKYLLATSIYVSGEQILVTSSTKEPSLSPNTPEALSTSIVARRLPLTVSQVHITAVMYKLLGPKNVVLVTYNRATEDTLGQYKGIATIRCLNTTVYTHWCSRCAIPLLRKLVDFEPHQKSMAGSAPHALAQAHDKNPTRKIIVDAISALKNEALTGVSIATLGESLQKVEVQVEKTIGNAEARIATSMENLARNINTYTTSTMEKISDQQQAHNAYMLKQFQQLFTATFEFSKHMAGISCALTNGPLDLFTPIGSRNPSHE